MIATRQRHNDTSFTPPSVPEQEILREQVLQIYRIAPIGFLATILNSIIVVILMKGVTPDSVIVLWEGVVLLVTAARALLVLAFRRVQDGPFDPAAWQRRFIAGVALIGIAWGSISCIPFNFSLPHQVFIAYVIGGMAAGGTSTFCMLRRAFLAFAIPTILPLALHFFLIGDSFHYGMGVMGIVYFAVLSHIARHNYLVNRDSLLLRHENKDMIDILRNANEEVAALNEELSGEIALKLEAEAELKEHHRRLAAMVEERTADLVRANEQLKREIDERKAVEQKLMESSERLVLAQRAGRVGVFDWNIQTDEVVITGEVERLYGVAPQETLRNYGMWAERVYPEDLRRIEEDLRRWQAERARQVEFEFRVVGAGGGIRWIAATARISYDAHGTALRMIGTNVDVTERKEAQDALCAAKEAAEAANRAKSQFLANMSHEMRTPLAGALGMIRLVLDMRIGDEERDLLEMARRSCDSLLRLIEDVLDFSRAEAGVLRFERKAFGVAEVVKSAVETVSLSARERGISLSWKVEDTVPQEVEGDPGRIRQVLLNLVGNALKFTERGAIEVTARLFREGAEEAAAVLFSVKDSGVGIATEEQERIFEYFTQIDSSLTRRYSGAGLGLSLARQIVEALGGRIWLESSAGVGSTFYFTIPMITPPLP